MCIQHSRSYTPPKAMQTSASLIPYCARAWWNYTLKKWSTYLSAAQKGPCVDVDCTACTLSLYNQLARQTRGNGIAVSTKSSKKMADSPSCYHVEAACGSGGLRRVWVGLRLCVQFCCYSREPSHTVRPQANKTLPSVLSGVGRREGAHRV